MCVVYTRVVFLCCIQITLLSATSCFEIFFAASWSYSKDESFYLSCANRTDSLPRNFVEFIVKLFQCNQVELYASVLALFDIFPVSINDTAE